MSYPELTGLPHLYSGKVRETYTVGSDKLLIVTTDRISAFDHVVGEIPKKGELLNAMSNFWFQKFQDVVPNHLTGIAPESVVAEDQVHLVAARSIVAKRLNPIAIEAVVRGYLVGSGWEDYQNTGAVCGIELPPGLVLADKLAQPIFTPATKAPMGKHDQNISFVEMEATIGPELAAQMRVISIKLYVLAQVHAMTRGITIADTKFEFGLDEQGNLVLMDEVLTPDSSRYWPTHLYATGSNPPSYDKQYVRDYLKSCGWDGKGDTPPPHLPRTVVANTATKYAEAYRALCW